MKGTVTVLLREILTGEKEKASPILCADHGNPAVAYGDNCFNVFTIFTVLPFSLQI